MLLNTRMPCTHMTRTTTKDAHAHTHTTANDAHAGHRQADNRSSTRCTHTRRDGQQVQYSLVV
jgi:hypothetical protein